MDAAEALHALEEQTTICVVPKLACCCVTPMQIQQPEQKVLFA